MAEFGTGPLVDPKKGLLDHEAVNTPRHRAAFKAAAFTAVSIFLVFTIGNQFLFVRTASLHWWTDLWWTAVSLGAGLICLAVTRNIISGKRAAWFLFGLGCLTWSLGMVAWNVYELLLGWITPFPSIADLGYTAFGILILAGSFFVVDSTPFSFQRSKLLLDSLILINILALSLLVLFFEALDESNVSILGKAAALFYPIVPITACYILWIVRGRTEETAHRQALGWVMMGMVVYSVANTGYLVPIVSGGYVVGSILDPLWVGAFLLIGLGAVRIGFDSKGMEAEASRA